MATNDVIEENSTLSTTPPLKDYDYVDDIDKCLTQAYSKSQATTPIVEVMLSKFSRLTPGGETSNTAVCPVSEDSIDSRTSWLNQIKGRITKKMEVKYSDFKKDRKNELVTSCSYHNTAANIDAPLKFEVSMTQGETHNSSNINHDDAIPDEATDDEIVILPDTRAGKTRLLPAPTSLLLPSHVDTNSVGVASKSLTGESETKIVESSDSQWNSPSKSFRRRILRLMRRNGSFSESTSKLSTPIEHCRDVWSDSDVIEPAEEADEALIFNNDKYTLTSSQKMSQILAKNNDEKNIINWDEDVNMSFNGVNPRLHSVRSYWISAFILAVAITFQVLPLPYWFTGCITGFFFGSCFTLWVLSSLFEAKKVVNITTTRHPKILPARAYVNQGCDNVDVGDECLDIEKNYVWMNLLPSNLGTYDPATYDIRQTTSVRIKQFGPYLEIRFPLLNVIPMRRMHSDPPLPTKVEFYDHKEVIDLSNASVSILPENITAKRIWSKKYPIRIMTNVRNSCEATSLEASPKSPNSQVCSSETNSKEMLSCSNESQSILITQKYDADDGALCSFDEDKKNLSCDAPSSVGPKHVFMSAAESDQRCFYLFARTDREKEEWFSKFNQASHFMKDWMLKHTETSYPSNTTSNLNKDETFINLSSYVPFCDRMEDFKRYMDLFPMASDAEDAVRRQNGSSNTTPEGNESSADRVAFLNFMAGRIWYDLHKNHDFVKILTDKLTKKLLKIKVAQYFNDLSVISLDLGSLLPQILSVSHPWTDNLGIWLNLEVEYNGVCTACIETQGFQFRLPPLRDEAAIASFASSTNCVEVNPQHASSRDPPLQIVSAIEDSDEEDSAEEDDEENHGINMQIPVGNEPCISGSSPDSGFRHRVLKNILQSDIASKVVESDWFRKNITRKNMRLTLQVRAFKGTLTINIPPPPSDRIWYGFRDPPVLDIALQPMFGKSSLGKYEAAFSAVIKLVENRIKQEFIKILVYPNMDNFVLPFMDKLPTNIN